MADTLAKSTELSRFVDKRIKELVGVKSQKDIAREAGFANQNIISMIKTGDAKLAPDRVAKMEAALKVKAGSMMRMTLLQYYSKDVVKDITQAFGVSANERQIVNSIRLTSGGTDPKLDSSTKELLEDIFKN